MRGARVAGGALAVALAAGAGLATWAATDTENRPGSSAVTSPTAGLPDVSAVPVTATSVERPVAPSSTDRAVDLGPVAVVEEGLAAWGRFAASRDMADVEAWFEHDGPQYRQFRAETDDASSTRRYTVTSEIIESEETGDEARVRVDAMFIRTGEPSQRFRWVVVLRNRADGWRIWTVEEDPS